MGEISHGKKPRVLLVDDEPFVLEGLVLILGRSFECKTVTRPDDAIVALSSDEPFAVILSDMRMPGMTGSQLLAKAREICRHTSRILLTGQADLSSAMAAVNEGQVLRFLCKPAQPEQLRAAVVAGVEQHRLYVAERELLEQTLRGVVHALVDVLGIVHPDAFGHAGRLRSLVAKLGASAKVPDLWALQVAAELSMLWVIALPAETIHRAMSGVVLTDSERSAITRAQSLVDTLLARIPRLEQIRALVQRVATPKPAPSKAEAVLRLAIEIAHYEVRGFTIDQAIDVLSSRTPKLEAELLSSLDALRERRASDAVFELRACDLVPELVLAVDLFNDSGTLLARKGYEVTEGFAERLRNMPKARLPHKIAVFDPRINQRKLRSAAGT